MKKNLVRLFSIVIFLLFPTFVFAQAPTFELAQPRAMTETPFAGSQITLLRQGTPSPYDGTLLSLRASEWLTESFDYIQRYWIIEMNRRVDILNNYYVNELAIKDIRHARELRVLELQVIELESQQETLISTVRNVNKRSRRFRIISVSLLIASVVTIPIVYLSR